MAGDVLYVDMPPEPAAISAVHVWIGIHADGREAMLSADMEMPFGMRHTPLMSSRRDQAESMQPLARRIQREAMHRANRLVKIELRTFRAPATASPVAHIPPSAAP